MDGRWTVALSGFLLIAAPAAAQDEAAGGALFKQHCQMCHASAQDVPSGIGPNLFGVVGRKAASTDYKYTAALRASKLTWDKVTLDTFLGGPSKLVPGTKMWIAIGDQMQRESIVAYLAGLKK